MKRESLSQEEIDALFRQMAAGQGAPAATSPAATPAPGSEGPGASPFAPLLPEGTAGPGVGGAAPGAPASGGPAPGATAAGGAAPAGPASAPAGAGMWPGAAALGAAAAGLGAPHSLAATPPGPDANLRLILDVELELQVELGRTRRQVREILTYGPGSVIELNKAAGEPVEILINGRVVARGEVVVVGENFGVRITEVIDPAARLAAAR